METIEFENETKDDIYLDKVNLKEAFLGRLERDEPLLKELGIDLQTIKKESNLIFKAFKAGETKFSFVKNADITGPIIFLSLYALGLLINCKIHFGYIYFISLICLISTYFLLNVLDSTNIGLLECCSVLGYSFIPLVCFSFFSIVINRFGPVLKIFLGLFFAGWSSFVASKVFVNFLSLNNKQIIIAYPLLLAYGCFAMIVIF